MGGVCKRRCCKSVRTDYTTDHLNYSPSLKGIFALFATKCFRSLCHRRKKKAFLLFFHSFVLFLRLEKQWEQAFAAIVPSALQGRP